jgi:hypothetical protein
MGGYAVGRWNPEPAFDRVMKRVVSVERVSKLGPCLEWQGAQNKGGYGQIGAHVDGRKTVRLVHRVVYEHEVGPIPADKPFLLHSCDNPPCVRAKHLRPGTPKENVADMIERGRDVRRKPDLTRTHCNKGHDLLVYGILEPAANGLQKIRCRECRNSRGRVPGAVENGDRTHCIHGHEFTEENTYYRTDRFGRCCRQCRADATARRQR